MIKCMNSECDNYKHELEEDLEICPSCGKIPTKFETGGSDKLRKLAPAAAIASIIALFMEFFILFYFDVDFYIVFFLGAAAIMTCIIIAAMSRVIASLITTILAAATFIGLFVSFGVFG